MLLTALSWLALLTSIILFAVKIWNAHDAYLDWEAAKKYALPGSATYEVAKGGIRMGWLRLIDGVFWLALGILLVIMNMRQQAEQLFAARAGTRMIILCMMWLELAKVLNDRITRANVTQGIGEDKRQGDAVESGLRQQIREEYGE